jgi:uncharacterized membrane protein YwzB
LHTQKGACPSGHWGKFPSSTEHAPRSVTVRENKNIINANEVVATLILYIDISFICILYWLPLQMLNYLDLLKSGSSTSLEKGLSVMLAPDEMVTFDRSKI